MKKLLLFLLAFALPATAMHKRKHIDSQKPTISFTKVFYSKELDAYVIKAFAKERTTPIGEIRFDHSPHDKSTGCIYNLEVEPGFRENKIGYQLFRKAIIELKRQDYPRVSWLALGVDDLSTRELEEIYIAMVKRLAQEINCDLSIEPRKGNGIFVEQTPFKIIFK